MEDLKRQYDEKLAQKEELRKKAELTELKLDRAGKLVSGLAGERDRWEASVKVPYIFALLVKHHRIIKPDNDRTYDIPLCIYMLKIYSTVIISYTSS